MMNCEWGRKGDAIRRIGIAMMVLGKAKDEVETEMKRLRRKSLKEVMIVLADVETTAIAKAKGGAA